ncbi:MBL fold metallo-hydrolase [Picrophilus oshimae]|uniref:Zn-dependent hydrolase n=1 Tax=Picrophilus torridus (strain ATCC 700027 / DSM 9790 / JCM 10055 / NBRC 100828 / KAW 2/3) TaxID=1122961 RepID=Q6KZZ5_PICTO|nr:MBL fold metallo-hydrolase [Picrophilus oshimae]AAT43707.1 Zn-dependent hydrolase [Picrophilus oshimae DSM 9789]
MRLLKVPVEIPALRTANIYLNDNFIIDSGMSRYSYDYIKSSINVDDIDFIVISHMHIDHIGGALYFQKENNIDVYIGINELKYIENIDEYIDFYRSLIKDSGAPDAIIEKIISDNIIGKYIDYYREINLKPLNYINGYSIIDTPGHSPGSICIYDSYNERLFSGDHVLERITPNVSMYYGNPLDDYIKSLEKLKNISIRSIYPGHGNVINNVGNRIDEIIEHHNIRLNQIRSLLKHDMTAFEIASGITWHYNFNDMDGNQLGFAIIETVSHLKYLEEKGEIKRSGIYYRFI